MGCCCWGAGAAAGPAGDADSTDAGAGGGGGGGTNAGGAELTGAAGAGIDVSWVRGASAVEFFGPELLPEGAAAGGGGAIVEDGLGLMMELRWREDLLDSEEGFLLDWGGLDSISMVVRGPVPREHWKRTREMMRATCWSRMWLMTRPSSRCSCCMKRGRLSGCLARCRSVPAARRSMSRLVPIESGLSRR